MGTGNEMRRAAFGRVESVLLIAGCVLLANPLSACIDVLPDAVGWLLIYFALRPFAERSDPFARARKWTLVNLGISLLRIFFQFAFPLSGIASNVLMATAVTCLADIGGMVMFFVSFFKGFDEISRSAENTDLYLKTESYRFLSVLFAVGRALCTLLPELTAIPALFVSHYGPSDISWSSDPESAFQLLEQLGASRTLFWTVFAVLELILAVVWLVQVLPAFRRFCTDPGVRQRVTGEPTEEEKELTVRERTGAGWLTAAKFLLGAAALCCLDLQADGVRFLPFALFPALMAGVCLLLDRFRKAKGHEPLFRKELPLFGLSALLFLGFEFFRRFATVWDARAFEETEVWQEVLSAGWLLAACGVLFVSWLRFAFAAEEIAKPYRTGTPGMQGIPFGLLVLVTGLHLTVCALPATAHILIFPRVILIAFFALFLFRRMSVVEEQIRMRMAEEPRNP